MRKRCEPLASFALHRHRLPTIEIARDSYGGPVNVRGVHTNQHAAPVGLFGRQWLRLTSNVETTCDADAPTSSGNIPVQRIGRLLTDAAPQRESIGQRDVDAHSPCRIVETVADPPAGLQPRLHGRAAVSQRASNKRVAT